jgi:lipoprotein signal peptidase
MADQASKRLLKTFDAVSTHILLNNQGAFSLSFSSLGIMVLSIVLLASLGFLLFLTSSQMTKTGLTLLIAGGTSNLIDRLVQGGVTDIIQIGSLRFNLADMAIVSGALLIAGIIFRKREVTEKVSQIM